MLANVITPKVRNLVFEGGGVLATAYIGALEELHTADILHGVENFGGSSAGAIIAGLLACGATTEFIRDVYTELDPSVIADIPGVLGTVYNVFKYYGASRGDAFCKWYGGLIEKLTGNAETTIGELQHGFCAVTVNITKQRIERLNAENAPYLPLVKAVRMSSGYPGIFAPCEHDGSLYVDGGLLQNYPIGVFGKTDETLGLLLMSTADSGPPPPITGLPTYIYAILYCIINNPQKIHIEENDWARTIKIPVGSYRSTDLNLTTQDFVRLVEAGREATIYYLNGANTKVVPYLKIV